MGGVACEYHAHGICRLGRYGGAPHESVCRICIDRGENRLTGAGDAVALAAEPVKRVIQLTHAGRTVMRRCNCAKRQAALNKAMPFHGKHDA